MIKYVSMKYWKQMLWRAKRPWKTVAGRNRGKREKGPHSWNQAWSDWFV